MSTDIWWTGIFVAYKTFYPWWCIFCFHSILCGMWQVYKFTTWDRGSIFYFSTSTNVIWQSIFFVIAVSEALGTMKVVTRFGPHIITTSISSSIQSTFSHKELIIMSINNRDMWSNILICVLMDSVCVTCSSHKWQVVFGLFNNSSVLMSFMNHNLVKNSIGGSWSSILTFLELQHYIYVSILCSIILHKYRNHR